MSQPRRPVDIDRAVPPDPKTSLPSKYGDDQPGVSITDKVRGVRYKTYACMIAEGDPCHAMQLKKAADKVTTAAEDSAAKAVHAVGLDAGMGGEAEGKVRVWTGDAVANTIRHDAVKC